MKTSNKILLSIFGLIVVLIVTLLVKIRLDTGVVEAREKTEPAVREIPVTPFESITLSDHARVSLRIGEEYRVSINSIAGDEAYLVIDASVNEGKLKLSLPEMNDGRHRWHQIQITTPKVKTITLHDNAALRVDNLRQDSLEINLSQAASLVADSMTLERLKIRATGGTQLRSLFGTIGQVNLYLHDNAECSLLNLEGSAISGELRESASLQLSGWTEKLHVDMDQNVMVIKRH